MFISYFRHLVFGILVTLVLSFPFCFFCLAHLALQNVNKDYVIFLLQKGQKTKTGMNETNMHKTNLIKDSLDFLMVSGTLDISFSRLRLFAVMFPSLFQIDVSMFAYRFALQFVGSTTVERWVLMQTQSTYESTLAKKCAKIMVAIAKMLCCFLDFLAESTYLTPTTT